MHAILLLKYLLTTYSTLGSLEIAGAQPIGVCNGRYGNNLPSEEETVKLYNDNGIGRMRIYEPLPKTLEALRGTGIELILDVPNPTLESLQDPAAAATWVQDNIINYSDVEFRYIAVGNEVDPDKNSQYVRFVLPAMKNVHDALVAKGLQDQIKVSTATYSGLIGPGSSPPSQGSFKDSAQGFMQPIIQFLAENNLPLLANIYPYISYVDNLNENLQYALINTPDVIVRDIDNREYKSLFDALLDVMYSAVEKLGGPDIKIVVSESGWPSEGGRGASVENAQTYYTNLIDHVRGNNGTPKKQGTSIETFLFAMFDENIKDGAETEKHFGVFNPISKQLKYPLNFR